MSSTTKLQAPQYPPTQQKEGTPSLLHNPSCTLLPPLLISMGIEGSNLQQVSIGHHLHRVYQVNFNPLTD